MRNLFTSAQAFEAVFGWRKRLSLPQPPVAVDPLITPPNAFTAAQAAFDTSAHVDFRSNWTVTDGKLTALTLSANDARLTFPAPLVAGHPHLVIAELTRTAGSVRFALSGATPTSNSAQLGWAANWLNFAYHPASQSLGAYTRLSLNPSADFAGSLDNLRVYDLDSVDPTKVACDVIIVGGDSNSTCATSELVTQANREVPYDPRIWYLPSMLTQGGYGFDMAQAYRFVPTPAIEPIQGTSGAQRMSPCLAVASRLVEWSAARGRPLVIMALGDSGSGLSGSKGVWSKTETSSGSGPQMYQEMLDMKAALEALGPAHEIVGMVWSIGANDQTGAGYTQNGGWLDRMEQFIADVRADVADVPMVLWQIGEHMDQGKDGRSALMRAAQQMLDQDSGTARAQDRFKVVVPPVGNQLTNDQDPHYTAHGMQENGRVAGDALLGLLQT